VMVGLRPSNLPALPRAALLIGSNPPFGGIVVGGFALSDESDWFLYEHDDNNNLMQLAVPPGRSAPSQRFVRVTSQQAQIAQRLLVDWQAVVLVDTSTTEAVSA